MNPSNNKKGQLLTAVAADSTGKIFELDGYGAVGLSASQSSPLKVAGTVPLPHGSELLFLPDRKPLVYNLAEHKIEVLLENPYRAGEPIFPVAAFNSPGFIITHICGYQENKNPVTLPLLSYGAVGFYANGFRSAAICVDTEKRQDLRYMPIQKVKDGINRMKRLFPENRLRAHLETCALKYGCPAAKNFFLGRYEAPLPTATTCNARCIGCISLQDGGDISNCQERIKFTPLPEEITDLALEHIRRVKNSILSFGQGCEGDPLMAADVITVAIRNIRTKTDRGTLNMNTNASRPDILFNLFQAGLDSIRVSLNSVRENCYTGYFRPKNYRFADVIESIDLARRLGKFVSINYLNCPGFTDSPEEFHALIAFLKKHPINLIQWRNLNFDPMKYLKLMNRISKHGRPIGIRTVLENVRKQFPQLRYGYFNPPKEAFNEMV